MKSLLILFLFLFPFSVIGAQKISVSDTEVCFTPGDSCTDLIVSRIDKAKKSVRVQAYSFTSAPIAKAIVEAKKRGVDVVVLLDKSQVKEKYSSADFLSHSEVKTLIDRKHAIAHNKVMIIDESIVITGSFNFTKAAQEKNAENVIILEAAELAKVYSQNWKVHEKHSEEYKIKTPF